MAISKVVLHDDSGADRTLVDLTGDTVAPETLMEGATAHDKAGNPIVGTVKPGEGGPQVQSDWAENDPNNPAYVKNRFGGYEDVSEVIILPKQDIAFEFGYYNGDITETVSIGDKLKVEFEGGVYNTTIVDYAGDLCAGNPALYSEGELEDNGMPFGIGIYDITYIDVFIAITPGISTKNMGIVKLTLAPVKIDPKYLPDLPTPPDPLPPITPDDESAFLQVTGGKAVWNKLINRAEVGG